MTRPAKGWTAVAFGDVVQKVSDRVDPETSGLERYVAGEHMDTDDLRIRRWGMIGDGYLGPAFHMRFRPGQVLYGSRRTYLRKVAVPDFEGVTANTTFVLEPKDPAVLLPELLPYVMSTESFHGYSIEQSKGSVNPYINFSDLASYEFALPPLNEQRRIAGLLWAVEDSLAAYANLVAALDVIQMSCSLELLFLRGASMSSDGKQPPLPSGWRWAQGHELFKPMSGNGEPDMLRHGDSLFMKVADFNRNDDETEIVEAEATFEYSNNSWIRLFQPGAVVFPKRGATIFQNKVGILRRPAALDPNLMALVPRAKEVTPEFLYWAVKCSGLWRLADTTSLPQLNHKHLKPTPFPLPPLAEQRRIADDLGKTLAARSALRSRVLSAQQLKSQLIAESIGEVTL